MGQGEMTHTRITVGRTRHIRAAALAVGVGALLGGCGGGDEYANEPRPAAPINVSAAITDDRVDVSPRRFGAGPIVVIITNQSSKKQAVTIETDEVGGEDPGIRQKTSPINPLGTGELKVDVREGTYSVSVASEDIRPATVTVGEPRESAQNELLQP